MIIRMEIEAESLPEYFNALAMLASGGKIVAQPMAATGVSVVEADAPKKVEKPKVKSNVVELASAKKAAPEPEPEAVEQAEVVETSDEPAPDMTAPNVELSVDLIRAYAIRHVNSAVKDTADQDAKKAMLAALNAHFGVARISDVTADKFAAVVAYIDAERVALGVEPLDLAALAEEKKG